LNWHLLRSDISVPAKYLSIKGHNYASTIVAVMSRCLCLNHEIKVFLCLYNYNVTTVEPASAAYDHDYPQYQGLLCGLKPCNKWYLTLIIHNIKDCKVALILKQFKTL
jgi:hypothetical protein